MSSSDVSAPSVPARLDVPAALSRKNKIGLGLAIFLGLGDVVGPWTTPSPKPGEQGPPMAVLIAAAVLGLVTIAAAIYAWRTGNRAGSRVVAGTRILSALTSVPAFFAGGVPAGLIVLAAAGIVFTLVVVGLVLARPRTDG
jgi:hypothetical protein